MAGATGNIYCGLHEFQDMAFTLHFLRSDDLFVDIGANIGSYTILASGVCRAKTVAFEPDPKAFAALSRNVELNELSSLVTLNQCALGARSGVTQFTVGLDTMNHISQNSTGRIREVALKTLDHALAGASVSLIKLDVEGFEKEVIGGAENALRNPSLKAILTEDRSQTVVTALKRFGFEEFHYDGLVRQLARKQHRYKSHNALFLRESEFVQQRLTDAEPIRVFNKVF
jgi:FkbM family methyltransferase